MRKIHWAVVPLCCLGWLAVQTSCAERDTESPQLTVLSLSPAPVSDSVCGTWEENSVVRASSGDTIRLRLHFTDNEGLSQYKIGVHSNFDCHGHRDYGTAWQVSEIGSLSGLSDTLERELVVPANASAGTYHFELLALDAAGNELENYPIYTLWLRNRADTLPPTVVLDAPSPPVTAVRGGTLVFSGTAFDNFSLDHGRAELRCRLPNGDNLTAGTFPFAVGTGVQGAFSIPYQIPADWATGAYPFTLWIYDGYNNAANVRLSVQID